MSGILAPGTRVVVNAWSAWPERVGARGTVVAPPQKGYPQPAPNEVLVLLDRDPLGPGAPPARTKEGRRWTCVLDRRSVDEA